MASQKQIDSADRNAMKLHAVAVRKAERLAASQVRMAERIRKAEEREKRATEAYNRAGERMNKAFEKLVAVQKQAAELLAKQEAEGKAAAARASEATHRASQLAAEGPKAKVEKVGGCVETQSGELRNITKTAADTVKRTIGRKQKGIFSPLTCPEAQAILDALDGQGNVGDHFAVWLKGQKTAICFRIVEAGLEFFRDRNAAPSTTPPATVSA